MEDEKSTLFSLSIDDITQRHFLSIAKWNKFLGVAGIVLSGIFIMSIIYTSFFMYSPAMETDSAYAFGLQVGESIGSLLLVTAYLVPSIMRLKFARKMIRALAGNDQFLLNSSLRQLKIFTKFFGVVTIIMIAIFIVTIAFSISGFMR